MICVQEVSNLQTGKMAGSEARLLLVPPKTSRYLPLKGSIPLLWACALLTPDPSSFLPLPWPSSLSADKLVKCEGISLLAQNTSWLLLLLLSLSLLQATDFMSL